MFAMFAHEPAERMFLLSMKILFVEGLSFGFGHWNKLGSKIWIQMKEVIF